MLDWLLGVPIQVVLDGAIGAPIPYGPKLEKRIGAGHRCSYTYLSTSRVSFKPAWGTCFHPDPSYVSPGQQTHPNSKQSRGRSSLNLGPNQVEAQQEWVARCASTLPGHNSCYAEI